MEWPAHLPLIRGGGVSKFNMDFQPIISFNVNNHLKNNQLRSYKYHRLINYNVIF